MTSRWPITISTVIPDWYDPLADDAVSAVAAISGLVEKNAGSPVAAIELTDTTTTSDGPVWTWQVWLDEAT